jgi:hypothetical protein
MKLPAFTNVAIPKLREERSTQRGDATDNRIQQGALPSRRGITSLCTCDVIGGRRVCHRDGIEVAHC